MNLQQMKYVVYAAKYKSFSKAAQMLFVTQPSISKAIKEVEEEYGIRIFNRVNNKVSLTDEGIRLVQQISPILEQVEFIDAYYRSDEAVNCTLSVVCQHYALASEVMTELLMETVPVAERFEIRFLEVMTKEVLDYVQDGVCEIGLLLKNRENHVINAELEKRNLEFSLLRENRPYVYVNRNHPLAAKEIITQEDLRPYPFIRYYQGKGSMKYFSEEVVEDHPADKVIYFTDDGAIRKISAKINAYMIGSGSMRSGQASQETVIVPYDSNEIVELGWVYDKNRVLGPLCKKFMKLFETKLSDMEF